MSEVHQENTRLIQEDVVIRVFDMMLQRLHAIESKIDAIELDIKNLVHRSDLYMRHICDDLMMKAPCTSVGTIFGMPYTKFIIHAPISTGAVESYVFHIDCKHQNVKPWMYALLGDNEEEEEEVEDTMSRFYFDVRQFLKDKLSESNLSNLLHDIKKVKQENNSGGYIINNQLPEPGRYGLVEHWHLCVEDAVIAEFITSQVEHVLSFNICYNVIKISINVDELSVAINTLKQVFSLLRLHPDDVLKVRCIGVCQPLTRFYHVLSANLTRTSNVNEQILYICEQVKNQSRDAFYKMKNEVAQIGRFNSLLAEIRDYFTTHEHILSV